MMERVPYFGRNMGSMALRTVWNSSHFADSTQIFAVTPDLLITAACRPLPMTSVFFCVCARSASEAPPSSGTLAPSGAALVAAPFPPTPRAAREGRHAPSAAASWVVPAPRRTGQSDTRPRARRPPRRWSALRGAMPPRARATRHVIRRHAAAGSAA